MAHVYRRATVLRRHFCRQRNSKNFNGGTVKVFVIHSPLSIDLSWLWGIDRPTLPPILSFGQQYHPPLCNAVQYTQQTTNKTSLPIKEIKSQTSWCYRAPLCCVQPPSPTSCHVFLSFNYILLSIL